MKTILAFDSFKGCISAAGACHAAAEAIKAQQPDVQVLELPMSDGGEGLVSCVRGMLDVDTVRLQAHGPLMETVSAEYAITRDGTTAYMEMAATSGLPLVPENKRNPLITTTYGVGEMIVDAAARGVGHIVMGIGGSATNDGGMGMLQALRDAGALDAVAIGTGDGNVRAGSNANAEGIGRADAKNSGAGGAGAESSDSGSGTVACARIKLPRITVACDVTNPLCGPNGASAVFGPQKGATPEMVVQLDARLRAFAQQAIADGTATPAMMEQPGAGAADGLGFGLMAYLGAELKSGIDILLDTVRFDDQIRGATLVITGEGKSDAQTLMGKVPHGILKRCRKQGIPVCLLSGAIDDPIGLLSQSFDHVSSINDGDPRPLPDLLQPSVATENLKKAVLRCLEEGGFCISDNKTAGFGL